MDALIRWGILAAILAAGVFGVNTYLNTVEKRGADKADAAWKAAQDAQTVEDQRAQQIQDAKTRKLEQELQNVKDASAKRATEQQQELQAALADSRSMGDKLQRAVAQARAGAAQATACPDPSAIPDSPTTADPIGVLAIVLQSADRRATELAGIADARGIAGQACEREYDAAREALMSQMED